MAALFKHDPLQDIFTSETIMVQSQGMARWLSLKLANTLGIAANLNFPFPGGWIWRMMQSHLPELSDKSPFDKDVLLWRLLEVLPRQLENEAFKQLKNYLAATPDDFKLYQLAQKIADLLDQYMVYRPQWLFDWLDGTDSHWQAKLWSSIAEGHSQQHRPAFTRQFLDLCLQSKLNPDLLPERLSVFGISSLPPSQLEVLAALSEHIDIHFYLLNPCLHYWGDILTRKDIARIRQLRQRYSAMAMNLYTEGNSLLASFGKLGRDFMEQLHQYPCRDEELFVEIAPTNLLSRVQGDILYLIDRKKMPVSLTKEDIGQTSLFELPESAVPHPKQEVAIEDRSLQIHSCHSPIRELEVLHDQLLALFASDANLQPADVVVMMPSIDQYAEHIQAVFDSVPTDRFIPWSIADRSLSNEFPVVAHLLRFLEIGKSRFEVNHIFSLLEFPQVLARFQLTTDHLEKLKHWINRVGVAWGESANAKQEFSVPLTHQNTWAFGLERLMMGYALDGSGLGQHIAPLATDIPEEIGQLQAFVKALAVLRKKILKKHSLEGWKITIEELIDAFFEEDEYFYPLQQVKDALASLQENSETAGFSGEVSVEVIKTLLQEDYSGLDKASHFLTGRVSFCAMVPMRSIPFKVVCMLGLNERDFPRRVNPVGFDLMAKKPMQGDRSYRDDDRYLFLESILSARQHLYLSYIGRSILDNTMQLPSSVLVELLDYLEEGFCTAAKDKLGKDYSEDTNVSEKVNVWEQASVLKQIVVEHPLQPFSAGYLEEQAGGVSLDSPLGRFTYAEEWFRSEEDEAKEQTKILVGDSFVDRALPTMDEAYREIELDQLLRFITHPVQFFFNQRLGVWLGNDQEILEDNEPFNLTPLQVYKLNQKLLKLALEGKSLDQAYEDLVASGSLPYNEFGQVAFAKLRGQVESYIVRLDEKVCNPLPALEINLSIGDFRVTGWLENITSEALIKFHFNKLKPKDELRLWVCHLLLNQQTQALQQGAFQEGQPYPNGSLHLASDKDLYFQPVAHAERNLQSLLDLYWKGLTQPMPFFPECSYLFASKIQQGESEASILPLLEKSWLGGGWTWGEGMSDYYQRLYGNDALPFDGEFMALAMAVFDPLLAHRSETKV